MLPAIIKTMNVLLRMALAMCSTQRQGFALLENPDDIFVFINDLSLARLNYIPDYTSLPTWGGVAHYWPTVSASVPTHAFASFLFHHRWRGSATDKILDYRIILWILGKKGKIYCPARQGRKSVFEQGLRLCKLEA